MSHELVALYMKCPIGEWHNSWYSGIEQSSREIVFDVRIHMFKLEIVEVNVIQEIPH